MTTPSCRLLPERTTVGEAAAAAAASSGLAMRPSATVFHSLQRLERKMFGDDGREFVLVT